MQQQAWTEIWPRNQTSCYGHCQSVLLSGLETTALVSSHWWLGRWNKIFQQSENATTANEVHPTWIPVLLSVGAFAMRRILRKLDLEREPPHPRLHPHSHRTPANSQHEQCPKHAGTSCWEHYASFCKRWASGTVRSPCECLNPKPAAKSIFFCLCCLGNHCSLNNSAVLSLTFPQSASPIKIFWFVILTMSRTWLRRLPCVISALAFGMPNAPWSDGSSRFFLYCFFRHPLWGSLLSCPRLVPRSFDLSSG